MVGEPVELLRRLAEVIARRGRSVGLVVSGVGQSASGSCYVFMKRLPRRGVGMRKFFVRLSTHRLGTGRLRRSMRVRIWRQWILGESGSQDWRLLLAYIDGVAGGSDGK
jgi:hypothetical protein